MIIPRSFSVYPRQAEHRFETRQLLVGVSHALRKQRQCQQQWQSRPVRAPLAL